MLLIGFSGGPDSLCLLHWLKRLGYSVVAAHFNHLLRPEADLDAAQARSMAKRMGVEFVEGSGDVGRTARESGLSIEEAARQMRYAFLFEQAEQCAAIAVAVGHTADDQVETVLMHLLRGAGTTGLRGMAYRTDLHPWHTRITLIRPLLHIWRKETEAYCEAEQLLPLLDASNQDTAYFRNRLRHDLLPMLENYNPQIREKLWRTALLTAGDEGLLETMTRLAWNDCWQAGGAGYVRLDAAAVRQLPHALARRVIRMAVNTLRPGLRDVGFDAVERSLQFIHNEPGGGRLQLLQGLELFLEGSSLWVGEREAYPPAADWVGMDPNTSLDLPVPGCADGGAGWRVCAEFVDQAPQALDDRLHAWLDAGECTGVLTVRTRRDGDRFQPLGLGGADMKLKDFWINEKLALRARERWPLVWCGGELLWIPGFRPAHFARLRPSTQRVLHLWAKKTAT